jgi:hypothetical protein
MRIQAMCAQPLAKPGRLMRRFPQHVGTLVIGQTAFEMAVKVAPVHSNAAMSWSGQFQRLIP